MKTFARQSKINVAHENSNRSQEARGFLLFGSSTQQNGSNLSHWQADGTHLVETLYITSWHGSPPTEILSWISRSFEPKLLPSIVSKVPPSNGPLVGWIWSEAMVGVSLARVISWWWWWGGRLKRRLAGWRTDGRPVSQLVGQFMGDASRVSWPKTRPYRHTNAFEPIVRTISWPASCRRRVIYDSGASE